MGSEMCIRDRDAGQLAELIGHLYLKMSEHSSTATAHINTHADDIRTLSARLNKVATDTDAQFQDLNRLANVAANPTTNPAPAAPIQGMNPACNSRNKNFTFRPYTHEKKDEQWISWIRMFEDAAEMAELSGHQRKLALSYSMRGRAARATDDIGIRLDPQGRAYSYAEVKAAYEARFITPGETQIARTGFLNSKQKEGEDELDWHVRCRSLYVRAYPTMDAQTSTELIIQFSKGLKWRVLGHFVQDGSPTTYSDALTRCLQKKATCAMMDGSRGRQEEPMEIGAITRGPDPALESPSVVPPDSDDEEELIAAFGKNAARKNTRYTAQGAKPKNKKTNRPPLTAKKIREREERRKKAVCHWCKETGHYQRQCPEYVQCHLQFLRRKGIEVHDQDLDRNAMEIAALAEGIFSPDPSPYLTEELEQHLDQLGLVEEEEDF